MPPVPANLSFYDTVTAAVRHFAENGFDSQRDLDEWLTLLRLAAERDLIPEAEMALRLRDTLRAAYERAVERGALFRQHSDLSRFTVSRIKPKLRDELDRRIMASAQLIRFNRTRAIEDTLARFAGWATSVPPGGSDVVTRRAINTSVRKAMTSLPFRERRVAIDQGHKLLANLSEIVAHDGGALAGIWHQHYTRYPRAEHRARDGKVYAVRSNWALERGLMKPGPAGYTDEITRPGEEVYCRCSMEYIYVLRRLPPAMLTVKGTAELVRVRDELKKAA
jgi:hypothetical protein